MIQALAYAAHDVHSAILPFHFALRALQPNDVSIDILCCGVCHTDLHKTRDHWRNIMFPVVSGHEIAGRLAAVGTDVGLFKIGDRVAVGCTFDGCQKCDQCYRGREQMCRKGLTLAYNDVRFRFVIDMAILGRD